jgi:hypothetical protein
MMNIYKISEISSKVGVNFLLNLAICKDGKPKTTELNSKHVESLFPPTPAPPLPFLSTVLSPLAYALMEAELDGESPALAAFQIENFLRRTLPNNPQSKSFKLCNEGI